MALNMSDKINPLLGAGRTIDRLVTAGSIGDEVCAGGINHVFWWVDDAGRAGWYIDISGAFGGAYMPARFEGITMLGMALARRRQREFDASWSAQKRGGGSGSRRRTDSSGSARSGRGGRRRRGGGHTHTLSTSWTIREYCSRANELLSRDDSP